MQQDIVTVGVDLAKTVFQVHAMPAPYFDQDLGLGKRVDVLNHKQIY